MNTIHYRTERVEALTAAASRTHTTGSTCTPHSSCTLIGMADELVAVWDGEPARGYGGTADVVGAARERGVPVTVIWPPGSARD